MKASVLVYEKPNFVPLVYMLKGLKKRNLERVNLVNQRTRRKYLKNTPAEISEKPFKPFT